MEGHMDVSGNNWLALIYQQAAQARLPHVDLLVDACNLAYPLLARLAEQEPPPALTKLLHGTPEEAIADSGPLLLRVPLTAAQEWPWLNELLASANAHQHVLALLSPWAFPELASHLRHCTQCEWNDGRSSGLLRFYDPRLLLAIHEALDPQQLWFHAPVITWHWQDRDRQPRSLAGNLQRHGELPSPLPSLRFKPQQVASLLAWNAAEDYRRSWGVQPSDYGLAQQEALMRHLLHAQLQANREEVHDIDQREGFVRAWLAKHSPVAPPANTEALA
jgi:hypothetical protein